MYSKWNDNSKEYWTISKNKCQKVMKITQNLTLKLKLNPRPIILIKTVLFKGNIPRIIRKLQAMHSNLTYTHFTHILQPKKIHITRHTRICHYNAQNSGDDHNTYSKMSQDPIVGVQTMWHWIGKEIMQETQQKNAQKYTYQEKKLAHIFFINFNMKNHHQTVKNALRNS